MQVCARSRVFARACGHWVANVLIFFPKKIVIEADHGIFHDHRSRHQVIEHGDATIPPRSLPPC